MRSFFQQYGAMKRFKSLPREQRQVVFYSEDASGWLHMGPIAQELIARGAQVCWLSSSARDPGLQLQGAHAFPIGDGIVRTLLFATLKCDVLAMTTPDLQTYQLKRVPGVGRYAYIHHSLVSQHMIYRPHAFRAFDAILCCGAHHVRETLAENAKENIPQRLALEHGYARLDALLQSPHRNTAPATQPHVLIAPTWGAHGIIEGGYAPAIIRVFAGLGYRITLRPHPRTAQLNKNALDALLREFPNVALDRNPESDASIYSADLLVSDWSGIALEYAFARLRPVIFLDTPPKVNDPAYADLGIVPFEMEVRERIGTCIAPGHAEALSTICDDFLKNASNWRERIETVRSKHVFNPGTSAKAGADHLMSLAHA